MAENTSDLIVERRLAPHGEDPETRYPDAVLEGGRGPGCKEAAVVGAALAGGVLLWGLRRR
jgi:hypothetical protein